MKSRIQDIRDPWRLVGSDLIRDSPGMIVTAEEVYSGHDTTCTVFPVLAGFLGIAVSDSRFDPENSHPCSTGHKDAATHTNKSQTTYELGYDMPNYLQQTLAVRVVPF